MSILADYFRPFWLPRINEVSGNQQQTIVGWLASEQYQIYSDLNADGCDLSFVDVAPLAAAFAADVSRMGGAAFESIEAIVPSASLPKSVGWLIIRSYYSAFFAAHAVLRMLGHSCTQLDATHIASLHRVADAFGHRAGHTLQRGFYVLTVSAPNCAMTLRRLDAGTDGSHGAMWTVFYDLMGDISTQLLSAPGASLPAQQVAAKLYELRSVLSNFGGSARGTWLSYVRNRANYQHAFAAWFPYRQRPAYYGSLYQSVKRWRDDPMTISVWAQAGRDVQRFIEVCAIIVAICRVMSEDMAERCPQGRSFHEFGALAVLNHLTE